MNPDDSAILATLLTAFLVREGGKVTMPRSEWMAAVKHESTIWVEKDKEGQVMVALISKEDARA